MKLFQRAQVLLFFYFLGCTPGSNYFGYSFKLSSKIDPGCLSRTIKEANLIAKSQQVSVFDGTEKRDYFSWGFELFEVGSEFKDLGGMSVSYDPSQLSLNIGFGVNKRRFEDLTTDEKEKIRRQFNLTKGTVEKLKESAVKECKLQGVPSYDVCQRCNLLFYP